MSNRKSPSDHRRSERRAEKQQPDRRMVASGELLAIDPRALIKGPDAFFWMFGPACPPMKRVGDTAIIYVRGSLEHHEDYCSCSYESLIRDVKSAYEGDEENEPVEKVVLAFDSPGGVVSGLYEAVDELKSIASGKSLTAYVEGLCASAAYALACACSKITVSRSSIVGSIGVIATMYSQARRDKAMGIDIITITSGKRKADGHPHVEITSAAVRAEQRRVRTFADGFFDLVQAARGFDPEPYEAGLFVGKDAVKADYADRVGTLSEFITSQEKNVATVAATVAQSVTAQSGTPEDLMRLKTAIKNTKAAIKAAKTEAEKAQLRMDLAALQRSSAITAGSSYEKTTKEKEVVDDEEEEAEEEDDEEEAEDEAEADDDGEDAESEDAEDEAEADDDGEDAESDDEEKKASAALASLKGLKGKTRDAVKAAQKALTRSAATRKAMRGELRGNRSLAKQVRELAEANERRDRNAAIDGALASGRITPGESKQLRKQSTDHVAAFLSARPKAIVGRSLSADLKSNPTMVSQSMANFAPADVTAEITAEMREASERTEMLSGGKIKAADFLKDFQASVTPKEHH